MTMTSLFVKLLREINDKRIQLFSHIIFYHYLYWVWFSFVTHFDYKINFVTSSFKQVLKVILFGQRGTVNDDINLLRSAQMLAYFLNFLKTFNDTGLFL